MNLFRLRVVLAFGALALVQTYGCDSSPIGTDGGGRDAAAGAAGPKGSAGASGTAGAVGTAGHGGAGATGTAGHAGAAGASGTAGAVGTAGQGGGATCSDLQSQYGDALAAARSCTVNASGQCAQTASGELSPCFSNCLIFVNDATTLNALKAQWLQAGCADGRYACPAIACAQPRAGTCVAADGGGGVCGPGQLGIE